MEQRSEPTIMASAPQPVGVPTKNATVGKGEVFRRAMRLLLRRLVYFFTVVTRPFWRFAPFVAVFAVSLAIIGWMGLQLWSPANGRDSRTSFVQPSSAVENYLRGQQNYNAELMWASMSPNLQASQLSNGATKQTLQVNIDKKKAGGLSFSEYQYIGATSFGDDGAMYFYAVNIQFQGQSLKLPMTIMVDQDGKVSDISSALSDLVKPSTSN